MPRKPIEWSKCIIYKIWKDDDFYVGSTTDLASRKKRHKHSCNNEKCNYKLYQTIREKGGWDAWQMTPLEEYKECQSQVQARIREEEWRVKLNANLNMIKAFVVKQEYMTQYHQEHKEEHKQYYQEHKEEHKEYMTKYRQEHKEERKLKDIQYYQEHKEEKKANSAQYYQNHKEKINYKFQCECGGKYTHQGKSRHKKSIKHQTYLATI